MEFHDDFEELRQKASVRARLAAELGRGRQALRSFRFTRATGHLRAALQLNPKDSSIRRMLFFARFASWFQYLVVLGVISSIGFVAYMAATRWGPSLAQRWAPTSTPTRPAPTPTNTRRIPTSTSTFTPRPPTRAVPSPTPTPTPPNVTVDVLHTQQTEERVVIRFRVLESGKSLTGMRSRDFTLRAGSTRIPVVFEERSADDPVCMIVVVDNSGSILPGLEQIRDAIRGLNEKRKPGDELGLVLFAEPSKVEVKQKPSDAPLDETLVNGSGKITALWDGVLKGIEEAATCSVDTRYLIVLTDGADNGSVVLKGDDTERALQIVQMAELENLGICTVGVQSATLKEDPLKLAAHGCRYSSAAQFDELYTLFQDIFGSVRQFYRMEFSTEFLPQGTTSVTLRVFNSVDARIPLVR